MSRVSRGVAAHARHKRVIRLAKGYHGRRKSTIRAAKQAVVKALFSRYKSRRLRRRRLRACGIKMLGQLAAKYRLSYKLVVCGVRRLQLSFGLSALLSLGTSGTAGDGLFSLMVFV